LARTAAVRKDLTQGLRNLRRYWGLPLSEKVEYSNRLIEQVLAESSSPVVCWSGGKDSTVLLHLVLQFEANIPVVHIDTGVSFPETTGFIEYLSELWNLNLFRAGPLPGEDFWHCTERYGWPIFGKSVAQSVGKAIRTGNIRPQMSNLEQALARNGVRVSGKCAEYVLDRPTKRVEETLGADLKFVGIVAAESRSRIRLFVDHGSCYQVVRYYGRGRNIHKCNPLAIWRSEDIWSYTQLHNIPHCTLYDMGHHRNGCWPCAMGIRDGQLQRLRTSHPALFRRLMFETTFGLELVKIQSLFPREPRVFPRSLQLAINDLLQPMPESSSSVSPS